MAFFPMMVDLTGKPVLVVGGGEEGRKKTEILRQFGAGITWVAPDIPEDLYGLAQECLCRRFETQDLDRWEYVLVVAATNDRELNREIFRLAGERHIPVNVVDDVELCTFIFPAVIVERDVVCAVSSGGKSPYIAQHIKVLIRQVLPEGIGEINDRMGEYRQQARRDMADARERRAFLRKKLTELLGG